MDSIVNHYGRWLIDLCIGSKLALLNGRCSGDRFGQYTHIGRFGPSVIDYFICSKSAFNQFQYMKIHPFTEW